jgi:hypothetical protein
MTDLYELLSQPRDPAPRTPVTPLDAVLSTCRVCGSAVELATLGADLPIVWRHAGLAASVPPPSPEQAWSRHAPQPMPVRVGAGGQVPDDPPRPPRTWADSIGVFALAGAAAAAAFAGSYAGAGAFVRGAP